MYTPIVTVKGQLHSIKTKKFKDNAGKTIEFVQLSLLVDDEYRPLMNFTVSDELVKKLDLLKNTDDLVGKDVILTGKLTSRMTKVGDIYTSKFHIRIDENIELV